jgi:hypothetical protein
MRYYGDLNGKEDIPEPKLLFDCQFFEGGSSMWNPWMFIWSATEYGQNAVLSWNMWSNNMRDAILAAYKSRSSADTNADRLRCRNVVGF